MFQSPLFWFIVLASSVLFWLLPQKMRMWFLSFISIGYIYSIAPTSCLMLVGWTVAFYYGCQFVTPDQKNKTGWFLLLFFSILGFLIYFKYIPPIVDAITKGSAGGKIIAPLGISYYVFKLIHFIVEVSRGTISKPSFPVFASYLFLFPIFTAGPIERYDHLVSNRVEKFDSQLIVDGITRISYGLIKKFVIAEIFIQACFGSVTTANLLDNLAIMSTPRLWYHLFLMHIYLYLDFSAYSDIAIGTSRLFGIKIMENFNYPILASNIQEFWRRWHMSLSGWCQSYIYMPVLGLTRKPHIALYATFLTMGLWHAGTLGRIGWGAYHASGIIVYMTYFRWRKKNGWKPSKSIYAKIPGIIVVNCFLSGSMIFLAAGDNTFNITNTIRIFAKAFFINL